MKQRHLSVSRNIFLKVYMYIHFINKISCSFEWYQVKIILLPRHEFKIKLNEMF